MRGALARADEAVEDCLDAAATAWSLTGPELVDAVETAFALQRRVDALVLGLVAEADARGVAREQGATSTGAWLRHRLRLSGGAARTLVRDAAQLAAGPALLRDGVTAGRVSVEQARVIGATFGTVDREAGAVAADKAVGLLLDWARDFDPDGIRRLAERILDHVAPHVAEDAERRALETADRAARRDRHLTLSPAGDGRMRLSGVLDAETGAALGTALGPLTRPAGPDDDRNPGQRRHDALAEVLRLALRAGELPGSGGDATQVVVTTSFDVLAGHLGAGTLDTGLRVAPETVRRLACDAAIVPAVLGGQGQVLDMGRQRRLFTGPLRRALMLRDRGCSFPGCDRPPRWCDGHHVRPWAQGGETALHNAVLLCRHHHGVIHHDGWAVRIAADGLPEFIPPRWIDPRQVPRRNEYHRRC